MHVSEYSVLYAWSGFVTEEIAPIEVDGETWRRLRVTFPDHVKSHCHQQISCFGPDGLLRRQDCTIDIIGGATGLLYAADFRDVDGIIIPTARRGYAWQGDYQLVPEPMLVDIDMGEITIRLPHEVRALAKLPWPDLGAPWMAATLAQRAHSRASSRMGVAPVDQSHAGNRSTESSSG